MRRHFCASLLALLLGPALIAAPALAATPSDRDPIWVADGSVDALARDGQTLYLGGAFGRLSPATGSGVALATDGSRLAGPDFDGIVHASVADGAGGIYAAGQFRHVDGTRTSVVHLLAGGTVDPAFEAPLITGGIYALAVSADHLYVAGGTLDPGSGGFDDVLRLARSSGALDNGFKPAVSGFSDSVYALTVADGKLYIGGSFTSVCTATDGCLARNFSAALDLANGALTPWQPNPSQTVTALLVHDDAVYLGGSFACVGTAGDQDCDDGEPARRSLAKVGPVNGGADLSFDAHLRNLSAGGFALVHDLAAAPNGRLIVAGDFSCIGDAGGDADCADAGEHERAGLARLAEGSGADDGLATGVDGHVEAVQQVGGRLWVGGDFDTLGGQPRSNLGAIDAASGAVLAPDPSPNHAVRTLAPLGDHVFAGGAFGGLGGVARKGLAAIDLQTGKPTAWAPAVSGAVSALHVGAGRIYAGGSFSAIDGAPHPYAAAFARSGGGLLAWNPAVNGPVAAFATAGDAVYLGGSFTSAGGVLTQKYLAAVGAADGAARAFPKASGKVDALALSGDVLYVGGAFNGVQSLGSQTRSYAGAVDIATGAVTPWAPAPSAPVRALAPGADDVVLGGDFFLVGGQPAHGFARVDTAAGELDASWGPGFATAQPVALVRDGDRLVAAGYFGIAGRALALLDGATGALLPWNPPVGGTVADVVASGGAIHVAGFVLTVSGHTGGNVAGFTPAPSARRAPAISGSATLACDPGAWDGAPLLAIAWLRDGVAVGSGALHAVGDADRGHQLACRVTARTIRGSAAATSAPRAIPAATAPRDITAPVVSRLALSRRRPHVLRRLALRLALSEDATLTVALQRAVPGRRKGGRCVAGRRTGKRCTAYVRVRLLRAAGSAGANRVALPRKRLARPGDYRLVVRAADAAGNRSAAGRLSFRLRR